MYSPFVVPQLVRLPLPQEQWIEVKRELNYGEREEMFARMRRQFRADEAPQLDTTRIGRARMEAYILGWSFVDRGGQPVPVSPSAISNLDGSMARAIADALMEHEERVEQEREQEKNARDGAPASGPSSPSAK